MMSSLTLKNFPPALRVACTCLILTILCGYAVAILQVYSRSHFDMQKTVQYYRGDESGDPDNVLLPQNFTTILSVTHVHTLSQPLMFGAIALIFAFSAMNEKRKAFWIITFFLGSFLSNLSPWLVRYVSAQWVYLFPTSQIMIASGILTMSLSSLKEMWCRKQKTV